MSRSFEVVLLTSQIDKVWGETANLSFNENGATIHIKNLVDSADQLNKIQQAARQLANMKIPHFSLIGNWSLEAQWHFWQGAFDPIVEPAIQFAELNLEDQSILDNRVKIFSWVRQLINQSPEALPPLELASQAGDFISQLAPEAVSYRIISGEELKDKGYVGIYGVGRGSTRPPAMLELDFRGRESSDANPVATLVGKGITFDSGGYSMKSTQGMLHMKADMGGAATVAGALALAIANGLTKPVKLLLCCAENLVSGNAYKLSDILEYRNGVSVEVVNTDAEGRLVLADGLIDASNSKAPLIIDAATLTGAAVVAVGEDYNALFSMDEQLASRFAANATDEYDPTWRLPLNKSHQDNCPSAYADTANSKPVPGGGAGGASNAAGFLARFVENPESGWLHLDLAACYQDSATNLWSAGATGRGVRSIASFLNRL